MGVEPILRRLQIIQNLDLNYTSRYKQVTFTKPGGISGSSCGVNKLIDHLLSVSGDIYEFERR